MPLLRGAAPSSIKITFLDVGQGDAIHIQTPNTHIMIDGGPSYDVDQYINSIFKFTPCNIDLIVLTHPHLDHLVGLSRIIKHCTYNLFLYNALPNVSATSDLLYKEIISSKSKSAYAGDTYTIDGMKFYVLWPPKDYINKNINNHSIVLLLDYNELEILLLGDIETDALKDIDFSKFIPYIDWPLEIYKVSHHGAGNGTLQSIITKFSPTYCVISVGKGNIYSHPSPSTLHILEESNCIIKRTDIEGNIEFLLYQ